MKLNIINIIVLFLVFLFLPFYILAADLSKVKKYKIDNVVKQDWGYLKSVFDQPTSQRLTFESDTQITIVEIGLTWNTITKLYHPDIKQVIEIVKVTGNVSVGN